MPGCNLKSHVLCAVSSHPFSKKFTSLLCLLFPPKQNCSIYSLVSWWRPGFDFRAVYLGFAVETVSTVKGFPHRNSVYPLGYHSAKSPRPHPSSGVGTIRPINCQSPNAHRFSPPPRTEAYILHKLNKC